MRATVLARGMQDSLEGGARCDHGPSVRQESNPLAAVLVDEVGLVNGTHGKGEVDRV